MDVTKPDVAPPTYTEAVIQDNLPPSHSDEKRGNPQPDAPNIAVTVQPEPTKYLDPKEAQPKAIEQVDQVVFYQAVPGSPDSVSHVVVRPMTATSLQVQPIPPTYSALAWISCLCCCWPVGICAIIYSNMVNRRAAQGDYDGALKASKRAKGYAMMSIILGIFFGIVFGVLRVLVLKGQQ